MAVNVDPVKQTGEAFVEEDLVLKLEFLPEPAYVTDYAVNQNTQTILNFLRRLSLQVIGPTRIAGFGVTYGGGNVTVATGELLTDLFYINKSTQSQWAHVASEKDVYIKIVVDRLTFVTDPTIVGVLIPGSNHRLAGPNQYRATISYLYESTTPTDIVGTGSGLTFTRSSGTWTIDELIGQEVEVFDVDGKKLGPFLGVSNTTTIVTFAAGDATGGTSIRDAHYIKLADVDSAGVVTESIQALPGLLALLAHTQNTDTHTEDPEFYVSGPPTAAGALRVLTTADLEVPEVIPPTTDPLVMYAEINMRAEFVNPETTAEVDSGYVYHAGINYPVLDVDWGIDGTGTFSAGPNIFTVTGGHDGPALSLNELIDYVLQGSNFEIYRITANSACAEGDSFTVDLSLASGQANPPNSNITIRTNARKYNLVLTPYTSGGVDLDHDKARVWPLESIVGNSLPTSFRSGENLGTPGMKFQIELKAINRSVTAGSEVESTIVDDVQYGQTDETCADPVITVEEDVRQVIFTWPAPSGFDVDTMRYQVCRSFGNVAPDFTVLSQLLDSFLRTGHVQIMGPAGRTMSLGVRVISLGGKILSNVVTASGIPKEDAVSVPTPIWTNGSWEPADWEDPGDGSEVGITSQSPQMEGVDRTFEITGIHVAIHSISGAAGDRVIKGRLWDDAGPTNGITGAEITIAPGDPVPASAGTSFLATGGTLFSTEGPIYMAMELVSGAQPTQLTGSITIYWRYKYEEQFRDILDTLRRL